MDCRIRIAVQEEDFSIEAEGRELQSLQNVGALVTFSGLVREDHEGQKIDALFLEHYAGMTERSLEAIAREAASRWPLHAVTIIHRIGTLRPGEQIVFVGVSSAHRAAAFSACEFLMDYLKTQAPFWKKETTPAGARWVDARVADDAALARWGIQASNA